MTRTPHSRGDAAVGVALSIVGAAGFASKSVIAKLLYADGWAADSLLTTRAFLALPVMAAWALWAVGAARLLRPPPRALAGAAAAGALCYYLGALLDFRALALIDASVERVLLFSYPSMVVVTFAGLHRRWPEPRVVVALLVTYAGIFLVVTGLNIDVLRANLAGAGLVLACALTSALYYLASDRWTPSIGSVVFTFYALVAATACLGLHRLLAPDAWAAVWNGRAVWLLAALVIVATVIPMLAVAEGVRRLGAPRSAIVATVGPPTTILLGAWLLGERMGSAQWLGVALIVGGILALEVARRPMASAGSA
jgi:drug/metabolite transporter (DMT)-like permease